MNKKSQFSIFARLSAAFAILIIFAASGWTVQADVPVNPFIPGTWTRLVGNPVLNNGAPGTWDNRWVFAPSVILDSPNYKMWYSGNSAASTSMKIGYATSPDGTTWAKPNSSAVLIPTPGTWDANGVSYPTVIQEGTTYIMWYTGTDASNVGRVGAATSTDGIAWSKQGANPVLSVGAAGSWDSNFVGMTSVVKVNGGYKLWYRGGSATGGGIGYATSPDGLAWSKYAGNPVIAGGSGAWDTTPYHPEVIFDGTGYHMWYSGCNQAEDLCQEGYATSPDGMHWTRKGMILPQGVAGAWDDGSADHAAVLLVSSTLKMWYSGYDGAAYRIGYASTAATILDRRTFLPRLIR